MKVFGSPPPSRGAFANRLVSSIGSPSDSHCERKRKKAKKAGKKVNTAKPPKSEKKCQNTASDYTMGIKILSRMPLRLPVMPFFSLEDEMPVVADASTEGSQRVLNYF